MTTTEKIPFWLVWNPSGFPPKLRHLSQKSAEGEAERLAKENPGQEFYVLEPVCKIVRQDIAVTRYDELTF